ncbi:response regulator [Novosphingobium gossypii]|uniref:response regulator n=1 Tax=Novosphingobium gossypii TaxID=1604774 RepID=UPI003D257A28
MLHRLAYGYRATPECPIGSGLVPLVKELRLQRNPLIAVVDDDAGMCDAIAELLELLEYESVRFSSGSEFLSDLEKRRFDCLVSDVRMPGMDGCELGRRVTALVPELPIIFVSSSEDELGRVRASRAGGYAFLRKPLDADEFKLQIDLSLERANRNQA